MFLLVGLLSPELLSFFTAQDKAPYVAGYQNNRDLLVSASFFRLWLGFKDWPFKTQASLSSCQIGVGFKAFYVKTNYFRCKRIIWTRIKKNKIQNIIRTSSLCHVSYKTEKFFEQLKGHFSWKHPLRCELNFICDKIYEHLCCVGF